MVSKKMAIPMTTRIAKTLRILNILYILLSLYDKLGFDENPFINTKYSDD